MIFIFTLLVNLIVAFIFFVFLTRRFKSKTRDLEERNRRLSALRKLDEIMMSSSGNFKEKAQKIADAAAFELGFKIGVLALIDESAGILRRIAMSNTPAGIKAKKTVPFQYEKIEIPLNDPNNLAIKVIKTNKSMLTHDLYDLFVPVLDRNLSTKIQSIVEVKTSLVYPVRAKGKTIGVMIISLGESEDRLSSYEKESIENLADTVGIALDNALTYSNLKSTSEELSYQNRLLKALRGLEIAALSTREMEVLCQDIVDVVHKELGYFFSVIALIDEETHGLKRMAISFDQHLSDVLKTLSIDYKRQNPVSLNQSDNLLIKVIQTKENGYTPNLYDLQIGVQPKEVSQKLQKLLGMKGFFVYPLMAKDKIIGVIYYCHLVEKEKLSKFEFDVMDEFTREVSRVLDNAILYQNLKETSEKLTQANQKLKILDKLKDDFVSIASHELRTPMTAIRSYVWMALYRPDNALSEKMKKYLIRILLSTERLINLVNDMLNVSRIESGRIQINPEPIDMIEFTREMFDEVKIKALEKNINLILMESKIPKVFADVDKLHQVLLNLLGNSLKFTPNNGTIIVSFFTDGKMVDVSIRDNGRGIDQEDLGILFKKFSRLDNSLEAAASSGGTGLGLYISKNLVELMKGRIWVTSEGIGRGATFTFSLPIASQEVIEHSDKFTLRPIGEVKPLESVVI